MLTLALPKGRILEEAMPILERAGLAPADGSAALDGRRLMVDSVDPQVRLLIVRAADVQTYVGHGAAQLGLVGRDLLLEHPMDGVLHGDDTGIGACRLVVAARDGFDYQQACATGARLTVATKYPRLTRRHLAQKGIQAEIVRLYGSMELAPIVGLADVIVDLVATGSTLKANSLVEYESLLDISTHLVLHQGYYWRSQERIDAVAGRLRQAIDAD